MSEHEAHLHAELRLRSWILREEQRKQTEFLAPVEQNRTLPVQEKREAIIRRLLGEIEQNVF